MSSDAALGNSAMPRLLVATHKHGDEESLINDDGSRLDRALPTAGGETHDGALNLWRPIAVSV